MRFSATPVTAFTLFLAACTAGPASFTHEGRQALVGEITAAAGALTEAMNAGDSEAVLSFYRDTEDFTYIGCTGFILGGQAFARLVGPYYNPGRDEVFEQRIVRTHILGPDAAAVSLRGASSSGRALFWTQVWVRENGRWVITLEHESWPGCPEPSEPHPFTSMTDSAGDGGAR